MNRKEVTDADIHAAELLDIAEGQLKAHRDRVLGREHQRKVRDSQVEAGREALKPILYAIETALKRAGMREGINDCDREVGPCRIETNEAHRIAAWFGRIRVVCDFEAQNNETWFRVLMLSPKDNETYVKIPTAILKAHGTGHDTGLSAHSVVRTVMDLLLEQPKLRKYDGNGHTNPPGVVHWEPRWLDERLNAAFWKRVNGR